MTARYATLLSGVKGRALFAMLLLCLIRTIPVSAATVTLVPTGSAWKYLDNGSNQGTAWRSTAFNDSGWASGPAELGYGDGGEATVVSYGPNASAKYVTTYFRHAFNVANPAAYSSLTLRLLRDDGAVVYLNGTEIYRSNMPGGAVAYTTLASSAIDDNTFYSATVGIGLLAAGANVLAVEIHQANRTSSDISFNLELTASDTISLTRGPYLQIGTPTSTVVRWRTSAGSESRVHYGSELANLSAFAHDGVVTTEHEVTVSGLQPNTRYYYSIGTGTTTLAGGDANHFFVTSPAAGSPKPTRVWVLGDSGTADANAAAVRDRYLTFTGTRHTDLWLMLGDNAYETGTDSEFQAAVFSMYPSMLRKSVLWPTLGNHDGATANSATQTGPYYDIFTLPKQAEAGGVASGTEAYYSFDYADIHFVNLESFETDRSSGGSMMTWLQNDLAATNKKWIIAFWHHPPYTKGSHNSDTETELVQMRQNALPILEAHGVDLVLTGHSHSYERSFLLDGHYGTSNTLTPAMKKDAGSGREDGTGAYEKATPIGGQHEGAVYAVAGSSGKISGGLLNHPAMYISLNKLGSMVLDIDGNRLDAKFLDNTGAVADYFTLIKGVTGSVPAAPSGLAASASSSSQINLTWTDNSNNESGFNIERSTDGSNFSPLATAAANATSYSNTGLTASTTFYYRVFATNATGSSTASNTASATTQAPPPTPPAAPTSLTASAVSASRIDLNWTDASGNEDGFKIERSTDGASYTQVAAVGPNVTTFSNTGLQKNRTYYYRVRSYRQTVNSTYSNVASAKTFKR